MIDLMKNVPFPLVLGRQGESNITQIVFDMHSLRQIYGDGVLSLVIKRPGDSTPVPVAVDVSGDTATWTVTSAETDVPGTGEAQFTYYVDDEVKKTIIYKTLVRPSLAAGGSAPDAYESWLDALSRIGGQIVTDKEDALSDIETAKDAAISDVAAAGVSATGSITDERDSAISRIQQEAETASGYAEAAASSATDADQSAEAAEQYARQAESYAENLHFSESGSGNVVISIGG